MKKQVLIYSLYKVKWTWAICSEYMIILRNVLELVILEYAFAIQSNDNESLIF